ncbi:MULTISPECIES: hypothetical protein [Ramlibacter]|uniref:Uncharacterized protein n=1 Tax=Ramlibacter pinisoli TaxID=2682844 RepID=A0A6N8J0A9_9BURK|nr:MULTISPECIES: hypothetical protein [Ramlibacter]MBA2961758.1 hypothetical protein [Ramlibacter sp. CGMCC 1.13660]MVQ31700.1 hypothetical protein [Ramlibacter pinisoli]
MAHIASGLARRLARWGFQAAVVGLVACGGGGGSGPAGISGQASASSTASSGSGDSDASSDSAAVMAGLQAQVLRRRDDACLAAAGFTARQSFTVNSLGAGTQQQVRFAGLLHDGGIAVAWLSRTPSDTLVSWRLQWQRFGAGGRALGPPADLPYADDVAPQDVAVLIQPSGRIVVAYAVSRVIDPANPFVVVNPVLARLFQDGAALPGEITIGTQTVNVRSFPGIFHFPVLAGFDDGSFLGGWHLVGRVKPELWVQRVRAGGVPLGDLVKIDSLGAVNGVRVEGEQLITLRRGGWVATTPWRTPAPGLQDYTQLTQIDVRRPLATPDFLGVPGALPPGSVLLQDERGLVVVSGPAQAGAAVSLQQFNNGGDPAGRSASLALTPLGGVSLSSGEAALLAAAAGTITLQRIGEHGDPIGQSLPTSAPLDALAGAVSGGGLVLVWARNDAGGSQVMAQLFAPTRCSGRGPD